MKNLILFYIGDLPIIESDDMDSVLEHLKNSDIKDALINDIKDHSIKSYQNQEIRTVSKLEFGDSFMIINENDQLYQLKFHNFYIGKVFKVKQNLLPIEKIYDVISPIKIKFKENKINE